MDRLVLAHNVLLQPVLQLGEPLELLLLDTAGGDVGPKLDDVGQVLRRQGGDALLLELLLLGLQAQLHAADVG